MLKSRTTWPPGGFRFRDAKTGLVLTGVLDFKSSVYKIIEARKANPRFGLSTDYDAVANELDAYCCRNLRIPNDPNYCTQDGGGANFRKGLPGSALPAVPARQAGNVAAASKFVRNAKVGIKTYLEWFGDGKPESIEVAEARAAVCLKNRGLKKPDGTDIPGCPFNQKGGLLERFTKAAATEIMGIMGVLKDLNLHTSREAELHVCELCDCPMAAKQFAPIGIIRKHMRNETMESLPDYCWIKAEKT